MATDQELKRGARRLRRLILAQALFIALGWFSLMYGWGMEPRNWCVLAAHLLAASVGWPLAVMFVNRERDE